MLATSLSAMKFALVLCAALLLVVKIESSDEDPIKLFIESMSPCLGGPYMMNIRIRPKRNRTTNMRTYNINWTIPVDLDDDVMLAGDMLERKRPWFQVAYPFKADPFCKMIKETIPEFFETLVTLMGLPVECPIPAGNYSIEGLPALWDFASRPINSVNRYIANYTFYRTNSENPERLGCVSVASATDYF